MYTKLQITTHAQIPQQVRRQHIHACRILILDPKPNKKRIVEVSVIHLIPGLPAHRGDIHHLGLVIPDFPLFARGSCSLRPRIQKGLEEMAWSSKGPRWLKRTT